jgi:hypothetical protein
MLTFCNFLVREMVTIKWCSGRAVCLPARWEAAREFKPSNSAGNKRPTVCRFLLHHGVYPDRESSAVLRTV